MSQAEGGQGPGAEPELAAASGLLPPPAPLPLPRDLGEALWLGLLRGAFAGAALTLLLLIAFQATGQGRFGGLGGQLLLALRIGGPLGFFSVAGTPLAELWVAQERSAWGGAAAAYLAGLVGWVLGGLQAVYALRLGDTASPGLALSTALDQLGRLGLRGVGVVCVLPLPQLLAWMFRVRLSRSQSRRRLALAALTLGAWALWLCLPGPLWLPATVLLVAFPPAMLVGYALIDRLRLGRPAPLAALHETPPLPTWGERLLLGGPGFLGALVGYTLLALAVSRWSLAGALWVLVPFLLHVLASSSLAGVLILRRRYARALAVACYRLAGPWSPSPTQRRHDMVQLVRALGGLGRAEEARALLPQALSSSPHPWSGERVRRYHLGFAFFQAGAGETTLRLLDSTSDWGGRLEVLAGVLRAAALDQLDRPEEALAVLEAQEPGSQHGSRVEAVVRNNQAAFELHREQPDVVGALGCAREAARLQPRLVALQSTLGAALLAAGQATEALPLLEAGRARPALAPQSRAWAGLYLGDCYAALGRPAEARPCWEQAAAACDNRAARLARARLEDAPA